MRISQFALMALFLCSGAGACGPADEDHDSVWKARLLAAQLADAKAAEACGWRPDSPITFADDLRPEVGILEPETFSMVSSMIRRDQNALAIHNSFHDSTESKRAESQLKSVNAENLGIMKRYFTDTDFPGIKDIGENGVNALLLLVAHADADPKFQRDILDKMEAGVKEGSLPQYLPSVLKSIRPQVSDPKSARVKPVGASSPIADPQTPRQCYYSTRSRLVIEYFRDSYSFPN